MFTRTQIASLVTAASRPLIVCTSVCFAAGVQAADTGDAPDSYGLATHEVVSGAPFLGEAPPEDNDAVASVGADGDDIANGDDEDGVFAFPTLVEFGKAYTTNVFATNPGPEDATLVGWVDFDGDGVFSADEAATAIVPPGTVNEKFKLTWNELSGITSDFVGTSYARFRITSDPIGVGEAVGSKSNGEVEDYTLEIQADNDGDEMPDVDDLDDDNDGIPDSVEVIGTDTDGDGVSNHFDRDSDDDGIPDFVEAGPVAANPTDTDGDGAPDYVDLDSNNDGVLDSEPVADDVDGDGLTSDLEGTGDRDGDGILNVDDLDSDNDSIPDAVEAGNTGSSIDTDGDLIPDFLDLDSDNDGIPDLYEGSSGEINTLELDADGDGQIDAGGNFGVNGLLDIVETTPDSGVPVYAVPDTDGDGVRDFQDLDSDNDGFNDVTEAGGSDADANGRVDALVDADDDGLPDTIDVDSTGGVDADGDNIDDAFDADYASGEDLDNDGIVDSVDIDLNNDGIVDGSNLFADGNIPDADDDGRPDFQDTDNSPLAPVDPVDPVDPVEPVDPEETTDPEPGTDVGANADSDPIIQTGLNGAPGCSIHSAGIDAQRDPVFFLAVLAAVGALFGRRKRRMLTRIPLGRTQNIK